MRFFHFKQNFLWFIQRVFNLCSMKTPEEMQAIRLQQQKDADVRQSAIDRGHYDDFGNLMVQPGSKQQPNSRPAGGGKRKRKSPKE